MTREEILAIAKPILFNTEMTKAILEERKTATRRTVKPQPDRDMKYKLGYCVDGDKRDIGKFGFGSHEYGGHVAYAKPPYKIGDYLYVRETWNTSCANCEMDCPSICLAPRYRYKADLMEETQNRWRPSIHMPKEAARLFLWVTDVRVERLQAMTLDDFLSEGVVLRPEAFNDPENAYQQAQKIFIGIWNPTTDKMIYKWATNPWVHVIEFERVIPDETREVTADG